MNEAFGFQVGHSWSDLCGHVEEDSETELVTASITQVVQQIAVAHELSDYVERWLSCAHTYTPASAQHCNSYELYIWCIRCTSDFCQL